MLLVLFDIDGTVACDRRRRLEAGPRPDPSDRAVFSAWLSRLQEPAERLEQDPPLAPLAEIARLLGRRGDRLKLVFLTGREERYRDATETWLRRQHLGSHRLIMRPLNDWRTAAQYKEAATLALLQESDPHAQVVVFDDDSEGDCSAVYARNGWLHLKVLR